MTTALPAGTSIIRPCTCKHAAQDTLHGPGNRVFNVKKEQGKDMPRYCTCTVCGQERPTKP